MKTVLLMSAVTVSLLGATPLFAQGVIMGPTRPYDMHGYLDLGTGVHRQFGWSDYGYYQGVPRSRNHVPPPARKPIDEIR
jgi:hypothetical protein